MTARLRAALDSTLSGWTRFWFRPQPMVTLGLIRIAYGILVFFWTLSLLPDLLRWVGPDGVLPNPAGAPYTWSLLYPYDSVPMVYALWAATLAGALSLTLGWHSRLAALMVFVGVMSLQRRQPWVFNAGDSLIRIESLFVLLAPAGAALSLDRRRTAGSFWSAQERAPWALRLYQIQVSIIYLSTVHDKVSGTTWNEGSSISYSLRLSDLTNLAVPHWLTMNSVLMNLAAWGTLLIEIALGTLVWKRSLRPWVLGAGVVLHVSITLTLAVGFFTPAIFVLYVAFIPPDVAARWVETAGSRLSRRRAELDAPEEPVPVTH